MADKLKMVLPIFEKARGVDGTFALISQALGISESTTKRRVKELEEAGIIRRERLRLGRQNGVRLTLLKDVDRVKWPSDLTRSNDPVKFPLDREIEEKSSYLNQRAGAREKLLDLTRPGHRGLLAAPGQH